MILGVLSARLFSLSTSNTLPSKPTRLSSTNPLPEPAPPANITICPERGYVLPANVINASVTGSKSVASFFCLVIFLSFSKCAVHILYAAFISAFFSGSLVLPIATFALCCITKVACTLCAWVLSDLLIIAIPFLAVAASLNPKPLIVPFGSSSV